MLPLVPHRPLCQGDLCSAHGGLPPEPTTSVERPERVGVIRQELQGIFEFVAPEVAIEEDILMFHVPQMQA